FVAGLRTSFFLHCRGISMSPAPKLVVVHVDDTEEDIFLFKRLLETVGIPHKLLPFRDGEEAIKYFGRVARGQIARPHACFIDIKMTGYDGFDLLDAIRSSEALDGVSAVVLSSSD